jgi:hypothetical protein
MRLFHVVDFMARPRWQQYALFRHKLAETRWMHFFAANFSKRQTAVATSDPEMGARTNQWRRGNLAYFLREITRDEHG